MKSPDMEPAKKFEYFGQDLEAMSSAVNYHNWIITEFKPYLGLNVAEVGAGSGNFTELLIISNTNIKNLVAFEPSTNMYPLLKEKFSGNPKIRTVNGYFGNDHEIYENYFDSVLYINVLEHIENDRIELSRVFSVLKNGGNILIFVPALSWLYSDFDRRLGHYRRYYKRDLIRLIQSSGFDIIKVKYFDFLGIIPWYIAFVLLKKKKLSGSNVSLYDKLLIRMIRKIEGIITPLIGKNLLIVGKKNLTNK